MSSSPHSPAVQAARARLADGRRRLREQHAGGSPGIQVCAGLSDLLDEVVLSLNQAAIEQAALEDSGVESERSYALVAHGGYGRRDTAPFSDVDLMLLFPAQDEQRLTPIIRRLSHFLYDTGLDVGFTPRSPRDACQQAFKDAAVFTSLAESRLLWGDESLYERYWTAFKRGARSRTSRLIGDIEIARNQERSQFGDTVYLLCPNVKRTRGGLRDLQLVRWIGFARYGESDPESLERMGALLPDDHRTLRQAREYLLRLRNELHFHADQAQDVLTKPEQLRVAAARFPDGAGTEPVERLMREYFEHTGEVRYRGAQFVAAAKHRRSVRGLVENLFSRRAEGGFRIGPQYISAQGTAGLARVRGDLAELLRLMELANEFDKRIDHATWQSIREAMVGRPPQLTPEAARRFLALLGQPRQLAPLLRRLHQLRALETIIPAVTHARCRVQFNEYHRYTVDEHTLRAIEITTALARDVGPLGDAYRGIEEKRTLHLAVLMHDLGKGYEGDHSVVGGRLARETAARLWLSRDETETLVFLVENHLRLAHFAFRHDLNDRAMIVRFAVEIGRVDWLQMLFVLTCADLRAVGPGVLTDWKLNLLTQLYERTRWELVRGSPGEEGPPDRVSQRRREILELIGDRPDRDWWTRHLESLPWSYLFDHEPAEAVAELERLQNRSGGAVAWGRWVGEHQAVEYVVGAHESLARGIFHRLTGALTAKRQDILAAEIHTLADDVVLDRFFVRDLNFKGEPPQERLEEVAASLCRSLEAPSDEPPRFRPVWRGEDHSQLSGMPTRVRIDNRTSPTHTVISVFTYDCLGLLYSITRALYELDLNVGFAKIGTHIDQVVDVFYVTSQDGRKIEDDRRLEAIREELQERVERQLRESSSASPT